MVQTAFQEQGGSKRSESNAGNGSHFSIWKDGLPWLKEKLIGRPNEQMEIIRDENRRLLALQYIKIHGPLKGLIQYGDQAVMLTEYCIRELPGRLGRFAKENGIASREQIGSLSLELQTGTDMMQETAARSLTYIASDPEVFGRWQSRKALKILKRSARDSEVEDFVVEEAVIMEAFRGVSGPDMMYTNGSESVQVQKISVIEGNKFAKQALKELGLE